MNILKSSLDYSEKILTAVCVFIFAAMFVLGVMTVFFRFVIETSLTFPDELIRYLFIWVIALGSAIGIRRNIHAAIGLLVRALPVALERICLLAASLVTILFFGVLVQMGYYATLLSADQVSPILEVSMAWVYAAVPIGGLFGLVYTAEMFVSQLLASSSELVTDDH